MIAAIFVALLFFCADAVGGDGEPCGSSDCTYTQGYWKNHPEDWPVLTLKIGNTNYNQAKLLEIFNTPPAGNPTYILAHQLIAALLNRYNGASISTTVQGYINQAQSLFQTWPIGSNPTSSVATQMVTLSGYIDAYNNGNAGPAHCDSRVVLHCNDNNACTTDTCSSGKCVFTPIPNCCNCYSDCRDSNPCTVDKCGPDRRCIHEAIPLCIP